MKIRQCFRSVTGIVAALVMIIAMACAREPEPSDAFVRALRCGMSRADVTRIARQHGYNPSDKSWMKRSTSRASSRSRQLTLVDLTFHDESLVAVREGTYDPRTKRTTYRTIDLCSRSK